MYISAGLLVAPLLLAACTTTSDPPAFGPNGSPSAALRAPSGSGLLATRAGGKVSDDEFAVDAREVTPRRTPASSVPPSSPPSSSSGDFETAAGPAPALLRGAAKGTTHIADSNPPKLNVLYATNGRIRAAGPQVVIRGTVEDDGDRVQVTVNGQLASVKDKSFQRRISAPAGESDVVVRATDHDGNVTTQRFILVRNSGQTMPAARLPDIASPDYRSVDQWSTDRVPKIEDVPESGVYLVLMAGTPAAHFVKMPNIAQCREAAQYTENATCTEHRVAQKETAKKK